MQLHYVEFSKVLFNIVSILYSWHIKVPFHIEPIYVYNYINNTTITFVYIIILFNVCISFIIINTYLDDISGKVYSFANQNMILFMWLIFMYLHL